jgi:hypothetical protein
MSYSGSVVLKEKQFQWPRQIFAFLLSPLWRGPGPLFEQLKILFTQGWFVQIDWNWPADSGKDDLFQVWLKLTCCFWKRFFFFQYGNIVFPIVAQHDRPPGTMMWIIVNLHDIKKLSCKYDLFRVSGSGEDFKMTPPYFVIITPLKRIWLHIW